MGMSRAAGHGSSRAIRAREIALRHRRDCRRGARHSDGENRIAEKLNPALVAFTTDVLPGSCFWANRATPSPVDALSLSCKLDSDLALRAESGHRSV